MNLDYYQLTSIGDRKSNQDYMTYSITDDYALFVVADGLGGYQAGKRASGYFCKGLMDLTPKYAAMINESADNNVEHLMTAWIDGAVEGMEQLFKGDPVAKEAHTTCAVLFLNQDRVITAHCGDTRIYRIRNNKIIWRTKDHSVPQKLFDSGQIGELEMGYHPGQNQLTRSINVNRQHNTEINIYPGVEEGETFLLCTDGFWSSIKEYELKNLATPECEHKDIMKQAKTAYLRAEGQSDNLTVQWIRVFAKQ